MTGSLFREEVLDTRRQRLLGEVRLDTTPSSAALTALLATIVFGSALALSLGEYARRETVVGWLQPDAGLLEVQIDAPGRITDLAVAEGDTVTAGTPLFTLDRDVALVDGGEAADQLATQIRAERNHARRRLTLVADHFANRRRQLEARRTGLAAERQQLDEQINAQAERVTLAASLVDQVDALLARGFAAVREQTQRRETRLAHEQELAALRARAAAIEREISEIGTELHALGVDRAMREAEIEERIAALDQRLTETARQGTVVIRAPAAGTVGALLVRPGDSAAAGDTALSLLPVGGALQAELFVPSRAAGFIEPGQTVRLRYAAFPHQKFGVAEAAIATVSHTVVMPADVAIDHAVTEPVFRVFATLETQTMRAYGDVIPLQPGMALTADIVLEQRRFWEVLLDPILAAARR